MNLNKTRICNVCKENKYWLKSGLYQSFHKFDILFLTVYFWTQKEICGNH